MKTDSLFYFLLQTAPGILFELLGQPAQLAAAYEFRSVELKQTAFRIDGVLLPRSSSADQTVFLIEVQFQSDPHFYQRFFAEIFLFLRQNSHIRNWQAVVLFAKHSIEPEETKAFQALLASDQVHRIYLEDLRQSPPPSLGIGLVQLIVAETNQTLSLARTMLSQSKAETIPLLSTAAIMEMIETIVVYKFPHLSREEIEHMLGVSELKQTRVYQEALQEGRQEGLIEGILEAIELGLELKFGQAGLQLMSEISQISDLAILKSIQAGLRQVQTLDELRTLYPNQSE